MKRGFLLLSFISFYYYNLKIVICNLGLPLCSVGKESTCNAGYLGSTPELGRSPGEANSNPLQYPCLENLMDRGAWSATVHGVTKSQARLSD